MKILLTVLLTALFVFALATTWVDIVQPQLDRIARATAEKPAAVAESTPTKKRPRKTTPSASELLPVPSDEDSALQPEVAGKADSKARISRGTRESAELLAQKMDEVKQQESSLTARQESLRMIYDDIRTELAAVDELRKRTNEDLAEAEQRGLDVAQRRAPRAARNAPPIPRTAGGSPAIRGEALIIRRLVEQGKMETAVSLLKSMKGRDAANVLEALSTMDSKLAIRLADTVPASRDDTIRR